MFSPVLLAAVALGDFCVGVVGAESDSAQPLSQEEGPLLIHVLCLQTLSPELTPLSPTLEKYSSRWMEKRKFKKWDWKAAQEER